MIIAIKNSYYVVAHQLSTCPQRYWTDYWKADRTVDPNDPIQMGNKSVSLETEIIAHSVGFFFR